MNLGELARSARALGEAAFLKQYVDPALVFATKFKSSGQEPRVDTPPDGTPVGELFARTSVHRGDASAAARDVVVERPTPDAASLVVFVAKSERNPFGNLLTVGRASTNDLCIPIATVSKVHGAFTNVGAQWRLTDQRSKNGTFVDVLRLAPGATTNLEDGVLVSFGAEARAIFYTPRALYASLLKVPLPAGRERRLLLERRARFTEATQHQVPATPGEAIEVLVTSRKRVHLVVNGAGVKAECDLAADTTEPVVLKPSSAGTIEVRIAAAGRDQTGTYRLRIEAVPS